VKGKNANHSPSTRKIHALTIAGERWFIEWVDEPPRMNGIEHNSLADHTVNTIFIWEGLSRRNAVSCVASSVAETAAVLGGATT
jgi:hypothetical protein